MRAGQVVTYRDGKTTRPAVITRVVGPGPSFYKVLDLVVNSKEVTNVPHERDKEGGPYWTEGIPPVPAISAGGRRKGAGNPDASVSRSGATKE